MRITSIETYKFWVDWCNWLLIKVNTDDGLYGWGEGSLHGNIQAVETAVHELGAYLIGKDPSGIERHWQSMYHTWRWRGGAVSMTALSALDIALWDLEGKRLGVPVYRLLGGPFRTELPVYASHWMTGVETPEQAQSQALEAVRRGFKGFKWVLFNRNQLRENFYRELARARECLEAARAAIGPEVNIYIECAEMFSLRTLELVAKEIEPYHPAWLEEPIPFENPAVMVQAQKQISIPIATGERLLTRWEFIELIQQGGCKVVQPDVMHVGGLTEYKKVASLADTYYIPVAPHNPGGPICTLASMHLAASIPNFLVLEQMEEQRPARDRLTGQPIRFENGCFTLPEGPGLGIDIDMEAIQEYSFKPQPVNPATQTIWW